MSHALESFLFPDFIYVFMLISFYSISLHQYAYTEKTVCDAGVDQVYLTQRIVTKYLHYRRELLGLS